MFAGLESQVGWSNRDGDKGVASVIKAYDGMTTTVPAADRRIYFVLEANDCLNFILTVAFSCI